MAPTQIVPIPPGCSDGDSGHRPTNYSAADDTIYLEKVAAAWMKERGEYRAGIDYKLDRLPDGYAVFGRPRIKEPKHFDRWLYGHPNQVSFDSPNRFIPHFIHLMNNNGSNDGCPCTVCEKKRTGKVAPIGSRVQTPRASTALRSSTGPGLKQAQLQLAKPRGRPVILGGVDDEGTPDVARNLLNKLKVTGTIDEPVLEKYSLDWRVEKNLLPKVLEATSEQPGWVPRLGEIVLFVRDLSETEEVCYDEHDQDFKVYDTAKKHFRGHALWEAGVVTQGAEEKINLDDILIENGKTQGVNYSGFRIEPLPDPNLDKKYLSRKYKYVPLHHTRPFVFWKEFHTNIPEDRWHSTIKHALTVSSTFSLYDKYHIKGTWPSASLYCKGIYIGAELLLVGDIVRIIPSPDTDQDTVTDIMEIKYIKLLFTNLDKASENDKDEGRPYNSTVVIQGKTCTTDRTRAFNDTPIDSTRGKMFEVAYNAYTLYPRHRELQSTQLPFFRLLGRCHEAEAMLLWFSHTDDSPDLSAGLVGTQEARAFASKHDKRIVRQHDKNWFWADTRVEALDIETFNGVDVGKKDETREPQRWVKQMRVLDGATGAAEKFALKEADANRFERFRHASGMIRSAVESEMSANEPNNGRKRSSSLAGFDDEAQSEESRNTRKRSRSVAGFEEEAQSEGSGIRLADEDEDDDEVDGFVEGVI